MRDIGGISSGAVFCDGEGKPLVAVTSFMDNVNGVELGEALQAFLAGFVSTKGYKLNLWSEELMKVEIDD